MRILNKTTAVSYKDNFGAGGIVQELIVIAYIALYMKRYKGQRLRFASFVNATLDVISQLISEAFRDKTVSEY